MVLGLFDLLWPLGADKNHGSREALREARASAGRDPKFHLTRVLEALSLIELGKENEAKAAIATARKLRPTLTIEEVRFSHGRRAAKRLTPYWGD